jgi:hypothetical protein
MELYHRSTADTQLKTKRTSLFFSEQQHMELIHDYVQRGVFVQILFSDKGKVSPNCLLIKKVYVLQ